MKRGFVRISKGYPGQPQIEALLAFGVSEQAIYVDGRDKETIDECIRSLRKGDELVVVAMSRIGHRREIIQRVLADLTSRGYVVVETATGRRSDNPAQQADMIFDALADIASDGKNRFTSESGRAAAAKRGHIGKEPLLTREAAMDIWRREDLTVAQAVARIGTSVNKTYRWLGPRGFAAGRPRKRLIEAPPTMVVYFARHGRKKVVKIGTTSHLSGRMSALSQVYLKDIEVMAIIEGGYGMEKEMHKRFAAYRIRGEWFRLEGELAEFIKSLPPYKDLK